MEFTLYSIILFLNIAIEFCLSFGSDPLRLILSCLYELWTFILFLCKLVWTSYLPPERETKNIPQHQGTPKRRWKGGTQKGAVIDLSDGHCSIDVETQNFSPLTLGENVDFLDDEIPLGGWRYYQRPKEDRNRLISIPNSTLGQHHDTMHPHQHVRPGPCCQNFSGGDPAANRTGSAYFLRLKLVTLVFMEGKANKKTNLLSCKGKVKKKCSFPNQLRPKHHQNPSRKLGKHDSVVALPNWKSKGRGTELQGHQQPTHLEAWKIYLMEALICHFSASSSFPSPSSPSVVIVLTNYSSPFPSHRIPHPPTHQVYPLPFHPLPSCLPAGWPQPSPDILPQLQCRPLSQSVPHVHPQSPLQESGLFDQELSESEGSSSEDLVNDSVEEVDSESLSLLGETSLMSLMLLRRRQEGSVMKTHSSTKFEEIKAGGPPEPVRTSWHSNQPTSTLYVKPETIIIIRIQTPLVGGNDGQNTCQDVTIPGFSSQHMSHDNFNNIPGNMLGNLTSQALEFMCRWEDSSSHSVSVLDSNLSMSMNLNAWVDSNLGGFMPLRGCSPCLHGDNLETAYSASVLGYPFPASSCVDQEGEGGLGQPTSGTECPSTIIPVILQDPQASDSKEHLSQEIKSLVNNRKHSQDRGQRSDTSRASDGLTSTVSLHDEQPASIVDRRASQVPQVHAEAPAVSVEQRQEPRSYNIIRWCREKIFPNRKNIVSLQDPKLEKPGGVETGLRRSHVGEKDNSAQDTAPKEMLGSKSSETLSPKRQSLPQKTNRRKLFCCFQCLNPDNKKSQEKGSLGLSARIRSSDKNRAVFTEVKGENRIGEFLHEKMERRWRVTVIRCPVKFGKPQRTKQVGAEVGLPKGLPFNFRAPGYQVTNTCQEQNCTSARKIGNKKRQAQKSTDFKEQISCESLARSRPHGQTEPYASSSTRLHDQQGPQAALITAFTRVPQFVRQKTIRQNLKGKPFPTPN